MSIIKHVPQATIRKYLTYKLFELTSQSHGHSVGAQTLSVNGRSVLQTTPTSALL